MLTARQHALSTFNAVRGAGDGNVLGGNPDEIRRGRLEFVDNAIAAVNKAIGSGEPRRFIGEPSDEDLAAMLEWLQQRRDYLDSQVSDPRWSQRR